MPTPNRDTVIETLQSLKLPGDCRIVAEEGRISVSVDVPAADAVKLESLRKKAEESLKKIPGVESAFVVFTSEKKAPPPALTLGTHKISARAVAPGVKYLIAVASGKGGVGKSTVASNLAASLHAMGKKTGLMDADIYGSSQPRMMGLRAKPEQNDDGLITPLDVNGIKFISMGLFVEPEAPVIWRGPMVHSAIQQLLRDVDWGTLDALVIDLPPGTGDAQLSLAQNVPLAGAVIVSTPQEVALAEARKGAAMFKKTNVPVLGFVENMSLHICTNCGHEEHLFDHAKVEAAAAAIGAPFLGSIPLDVSIRKACDAGTPLSHAQAETFKNIAARMWMGLNPA